MTLSRILLIHSVDSTNISIWLNQTLFLYKFILLTPSSNIIYNFSFKLFSQTLFLYQQNLVYIEPITVYCIFFFDDIILYPIYPYIQLNVNTSIWFNQTLFSYKLILLMNSFGSTHISI